MVDARDQEHRRLLLKFLMASPFFSLMMCTTGEAKKELVKILDDAITKASDAINVFDLETVAKKKLPSAHYGYMATGVNDDLTIQANRDAFSRVALKMRRLVDTSSIDMSVELFGKKWPTPIIISPVGSQRAFHEDGELAVAGAAKATNHLLILSTVASTPIEAVSKERGQPVWFQLYPLTDWAGTQKMIRRAEAVGSEVLVFTVDLSSAGDKRETLSRMIRVDERQCSTCHTGNFLDKKPMLSDTKAPELLENMTWDYVDRLKSSTQMKLVIKGIETAEDAQLCLDHKADGIIVSNHGGRAAETGRGTLDCLPEIVSVVKGKIPVLIDGGFRRGTDIFKALALGADAICIGRPYIWGLSAFGQDGVEAVLSILTEELALTMKQAGTTSIKGITRDFIAV